MSLKGLISGAAAIAAIVAAFLWYKSATVTSPPPIKRPDAEHFDAGIIITDENDPMAEPYELFATLKLQSLWSKRAAIAASLAAVLQALALIVA
jgi:hypothetical protein